MNKKYIAYLLLVFGLTLMGSTRGDTLLPGDFVLGTQLSLYHLSASDDSKSLLAADFTTISGIAITPGGREIFISDRDGDLLIKVDPETGAKSKVDSSYDFIDPHGVVIDSDGKLVVLDRGGKAVVRIDPEDGSHEVISSPAIHWNFPRDPTDIEINDNGDIFLVSSRAGEGVIRIDAVTNELSTVSSGGDFINLFGITLNQDGDIFVVEWLVPGGTVFHVNPNTGDQTVVSSGGDFRTPVDIALGLNEEIYVADAEAFFEGALFQIDPEDGSQTIVSLSDQDREPLGFLQVAIVEPGEVRFKVLSDNTWKSYDSFQSGWHLPGFDDSGWRNAFAPYPDSGIPPGNIIPGTNAVFMWDFPAYPPDPPLNGHDGPDETWYRKTVSIPATSDNIVDATAIIGADDDFDFYVNGNLVFSDRDGTAETAPFVLDIKSYLHIGDNQLAIYAKDALPLLFEWVLVDMTIDVKLTGIKGDFNSDGCIDRGDLTILINELRNPAPDSQVFDLNLDGVINVADARFLVTLFTNPQGIACDQKLDIKSTAAFTARLLDGHNVVVGTGDRSTLFVKKSAEDRVVLEFDVSNQAPRTDPVYLNFYTDNMDRPNFSVLSLYVFEADGIVRADDFFKTDYYLFSFTDNGESPENYDPVICTAGGPIPPGCNNNHFSVDVTEVYNYFVARGKQFVGFLILAETTDARYVMNGGDVLQPALSSELLEALPVP